MTYNTKIQGKPAKIDVRGTNIQQFFPPLFRNKIKNKLGVTCT